MLVLTRRETEKLLFPTLGISIEVLRIRGNKTRLGVDAPADIPVVRQEVAGLKAVEFTAEDSPAVQLSRLHGALRQRLDRAALALNQLHRRLEQQGDSQSQQQVLAVFAELQALEREAGEVLEPPVAREPRALLVEDDVNQRELLGGFLRLSGFDVTLACDGQDALEYLSLHAPPDVVLLDMRMPRCDGAAFVREVRSTAGLDTLKCRRDRSLVSQTGRRRAAGAGRVRGNGRVAGPPAGQLTARGTARTGRSPGASPRQRVKSTSSRWARALCSSTDSTQAKKLARHLTRKR